MSKRPSWPSSSRWPAMSGDDLPVHGRRPALRGRQRRPDEAAARTTAGRILHSRGRCLVMGYLGRLATPSRTSTSRLLGQQRWGARAWRMVPAEKPTAHPLAGELAATPLRSLLEPVSGLGTCTHLVPVHR